MKKVCIVLATAVMAIAVVVSVAAGAYFWTTMIALIAWSLVFLTGALHGFGLTCIPALSFLQSVGVVIALSLLISLLRAGRSGG